MMKTRGQKIAERELRQARSRIKVLERALLPFAQEYTNWAADLVSERYHPGLTEPGQKQTFAKATFSIGDLRRAHALVGNS